MNTDSRDHYARHPRTDGGTYPLSLTTAFRATLTAAALVCCAVQGLVDLSKFAVRVPRSALPRLVDILRSIPDAKVASMQAELAKIWERYTYSGLFKREFAMQIRAPDDTTRKRVGTPPNPADQRSGVFSMLDERLRGVDAVDTLVEHLRLRLVQQREVCAAEEEAASVPAATVAEGAEPPSAPYVDHGPPFVPWPAVHFKVWRVGVV